MIVLEKEWISVIRPAVELVSIAKKKIKKDLFYDAGIWNINNVTLVWHKNTVNLSYSHCQKCYKNEYYCS